MTDIATDALHLESERRLDVYKKVTWRLIPFLLVCYLCSYLDRINVGFAKLEMLSELQFSETVYGLGAGLFFVGYVIFEIPSNMVMMRVGARIWIARIMVTWGILSAATMLVQTPTQFYIVRFLLGVAEAGFIPAILYYLTIWYPSDQRGRVTALFLAGIPLAGVIGGPLSGWIMKMFHGHFGWSGWQWMFFIEAVPTVLFGVMAFFYLDRSVHEAKWLTPEEKATIEKDLANENKSKELTSIRAGLTHPTVLLLSGIYFFFTMGLYGVSFWLPSIIRAAGVSDVLQVGMLTAIPYAGALVAMYLIGRSSDARKERRWHLAVPAAVGGIALIFSAIYDTDVVMALIFLTVATAGIITCIPQFYTLPPAILAGAAAAMGLALANSVGSVAGFVSPFLLGWVKDATGSTNAGVIVLAVALFIGAALVLTLSPRKFNR
ncbi:MAG TPA: MFS transporter [Ottowia sp.]|uniref:MFS transporter n=1 Tax=Ottowia sp. TaxID=1898956 RepID=UPI002C2209A8|nr:MFS transporter [Ottowia sp.]HMN21181.1 MFS transporter [Ottowia sp.]